jgi:hypothetical protein
MRVGPLLADEEPGELVQARAGYQRDVEFATRPIRDRYLGRLESLKRSLGSRGEVKAALAVQLEIDRLKAAVSDAAGVAKFAGVWQIIYDNAVVRRYVITGDGAVTWSEENGKPVGAKKARILAKGADFVLDFKDDLALERLSISGTNLVTEYFGPKASYPAMAPKFKGLGTLLSPNKD